MSLERRARKGSQERESGEEDANQNRNRIEIKTKQQRDKVGDEMQKRAIGQKDSESEW